ncbi:MAG: DUF3887 domain-containing protein, partial [Gemmatimonadota bacterium]|nr:DUF3887 domain-containing protein [Gemmatimonadota bacterium]
VFCSKKQEVPDPEELTVLATGFIEMLEKEDFSNAESMFDKTMKKALPREKLEQTWKGLIEKVGPFLKQRGVRTEKMKQYIVVYVTCEFEKTSLDAKVVFSRKKEISGLFFVPI